MEKKSCYITQAKSANEKILKRCASNLIRGISVIVINVRWTYLINLAYAIFLKKI